MDYVKKFLQVEGLMGQGSFGRVLMTKTPTNNRYALKCTHPILRPQRLAQPSLSYSSAFSSSCHSGSASPCLPSDRKSVV